MFGREIRNLQKARQALTFQSYKAMHGWFFFCTWNKTNDGTDVQFKFCFKQYWAKYNLVTEGGEVPMFKRLFAPASFLQLPVLCGFLFSNIREKKKKNKNECSLFCEF